MQVEYILGASFPHSNPHEKQEHTRIVLNKGLFDFHCFMRKPSEIEIDTWCHANFRYGMYPYWHIPFFIVDFGVDGMLFDAAISIFDFKSVEQRNDWLSMTQNTVNFFLVDLESNVLRGYRMVSLQSEFTKSLKKQLKSQAAIYISQQEVEHLTIEARQSVTTTQMIKAVGMIEV